MSKRFIHFTSHVLVKLYFPQCSGPLIIYILLPPPLIQVVFLWLERKSGASGWKVFMLLCIICRQISQICRHTKFRFFFIPSLMENGYLAREFKGSAFIIYNDFSITMERSIGFWSSLNKYNVWDLSFEEV